MKMPVVDWLSTLGLSQYSDKFRTRGYDNIQMVFMDEVHYSYMQINEFGITNDDLDYMGITHPLHR